MYTLSTTPEIIDELLDIFVPWMLEHRWDDIHGKVRTKDVLHQCCLVTTNDVLKSHLCHIFVEKVPHADFAFQMAHFEVTGHKKLLEVIG